MFCGPGAWCTLAPRPCPRDYLPLLLGAGSALLIGASDELASHSHGHNKRLALLPAGFSWVTRANQVPALQFWDPGWCSGSLKGAQKQPTPVGCLQVSHTGATARLDHAIFRGAVTLRPFLQHTHLPSSIQIDCQEHWTGWQEASPQRLPNGRGGTCSAACTQAGTLQLLRETGGRAKAGAACSSPAQGGQDRLSWQQPCSMRVTCRPLQYTLLDPRVLLPWCLLQGCSSSTTKRS